jgi:hypothetical protein
MVAAIAGIVESDADGGVRPTKMATDEMTALSRRLSSSTDRQRW